MDGRLRQQPVIRGKRRVIAEVRRLHRVHGNGHGHGVRHLMWHDRVDADETARVQLFPLALAILGRPFLSSAKVKHLFDG